MKVKSRECIYRELWKARKAIGTQKEFAKIAKTNAETISEIERNKRDVGISKLIWLLDAAGLELSINFIKPCIDWKEIRANFFNECVSPTGQESEKKVVIAPHDLFEWFKREVSENTTDKN